MNNYVMSEIDGAQKKMGAYVALLNYRYMNLCVKAELGALMPVTVFIGNEPYNIEDVANINSPDAYQFGIYPINENNLQDIIHGIYEAHPEFKMELKNTTSSEGSTTQYLLYTMPDVDENRHDFLENAIKGLHEECCARIDAIHLEYKVRLVENLEKISQADTDEAVKALDDVHQQSLEMADSQLGQKQAEIDEALARYEQNKALQQDDDLDFDYSKGMRIYQPDSE